jgi:hypothetical protein
MQCLGDEQMMALEVFEPVSWSKQEDLGWLFVDS